MSLESYCTNPACKRRHLLPDTATGKSVRCKGCGQTFVAASSVTVNAAKPEDVIEPAWNEPAKASASAPALLNTIGNTVGRFAIRGKLGTGAFGTVYRAYDPQLDRVVALKVPNPGVMTDAKRAERFLREAKAAANLRHPHIVPVFDAGKDGDTYYIASAFIEGQPLADSVPEKGVEFERAARIVRELADALAYAHEQGIVHRDVKPANIMIDKQDRVHLMDFGLASRQEEAARLTNDGAVMGTPAYMSPEQAKGQKGEAQPATDQYAAGVVLYELLTGTVPFSGPVSAVLANVLAVEPEPPHKRCSEVPRDLETICLKAMAKRPEDRYPACHMLAADLRRWLEGEPITARRMSFVERAGRWVRKEPKLACAAVIIAVLLCAGMALLAVSTQSARQNARVQDELRQQAVDAATQAEKDAFAAQGAEKRAEDALALARAAGAKASTEAGSAKKALKDAEEERKKVEAAQSKTAEALRIAEDEKKAAQQAKQTAEDAKKQVEMALADVKKAQRSVAEAAYPSQIRTASELLDLGSYSEAKVVLAECDKDLRGPEWRYLNLLCTSRAKRAFPQAAYPLGENELGSAAISADGRRVVTCSKSMAQSQTLVLYDVKFGPDLAASPCRQLVSGSINCSATDLRHIQVTGAMADREATRICVGRHLFRLVAPKVALDPDKFILSEETTGWYVRYYCTEDGRALSRSPDDAMSANGNWLVNRNGTLDDMKKMSAKTNFLKPFQERYKVNTPQVLALAVANSGHIAFTEKVAGGIYIYSPQSAKIHHIVGKWVNVNNLRFSRDGLRLAFIENTYGPIYVVDVPSGGLLMTLRTEGTVLDIGFDAESGSVMAVTATKLKVWYTFDPAIPKP